ncbi:MAG: FAD-dependent thymidylate synthase [Candidatus Methanomethylicota archaeon]|nr:FAD-dependent thymidylate synthase [Candidatus Culexmicrobium cathedralense]RLE48344.1 MAG: FAD-dependent thymidylate synthase [Candidatus Verstraetearchaeota archaeon]
MRVVLLAYTPEPERVVAAAIRQCRSSKGADQIYRELGDNDIKRLIRHCIKMGHLSPIEHASFTFLIEGISRVTSHQLVRHRIASYSQQSQRAISLVDANYVVPPSIEVNDKAKRIFDEVIEAAKRGYETLLKLGIPREDARYLIPQAIETSIVVTMNARELLHFFSLRLAKDAQWEIRMMAKLMLKEVLKVAPTIFEKYRGYVED